MHTGIKFVNLIVYSIVYMVVFLIVFCLLICLFDRLAGGKKIAQDFHDDPLRCRHQCTLHRGAFSSFFSGGFITAIVVNPPERKLAKRTSVHWDEIQYNNLKLFEN